MEEKDTASVPSSPPEQEEEKDVVIVPHAYEFVIPEDENYCAHCDHERGHRIHDVPPDPEDSECPRCWLPKGHEGPCDHPTPAPSRAPLDELLKEAGDISQMLKLCYRAGTDDQREEPIKVAYILRIADLLAALALPQTEGHDK